MEEAGRTLVSGPLAEGIVAARLLALLDPQNSTGMREAVATIADAVQRGVTIGVHGDYDVDGQGSTAILTRALRLAGATVVPFIPHRMRDGYDFGMSGLAAASARVLAGAAP